MRKLVAHYTPKILTTFKKSKLQVALSCMCSLIFMSACVANPAPPGKFISALVSVPKIDKNRLLTISLDHISRGFNPHLRSQLSQSSLLVAYLTLPSPYDEIVDDNGSIEWRMRKDTFSTITNTVDLSHHSQTIVYRINHDAQWSDNTPITGDDFVYLWHEMITQPGVVNKYGYSLIKAITVSDGGTTVTVKLTHEFPDWKSLFSDLLPSHALRDDALGFMHGLYVTSPLSGSYFSVLNVHPDMNEIMLVRNDRYWAQMPPLDYIQLKQMGSFSDTLASITQQQLSMVMTDSSQELYDAINSLNNITTFAYATPQLMSLYINPHTMKHTEYRAAFLTALDYSSLVNSAFLDRIHTSGYAAIAGLGFNCMRMRQEDTYISDADHNLRQYLQNNGFTLRDKRNFIIRGHRDNFDQPPQLLAQDLEEYSPSTIYATKNNRPAFVVIGVVNDDPYAQFVALNLAQQIRRFHMIPKIRLLSAEELFNKKSTYLDVMISYDRLGFGALSDQLAPVNTDFFAPTRISVTGNRLDDSQLNSRINALLHHPTDTTVINQWQQYFARQWLWMPLGQRNQFTVINPSLFFSATIRPTLTGGLTDIQSWNFPAHTSTIHTR